ncbi:MAG: CotH kinase family protein [Clostridia bacterium]|nr:CotH kinase family protein [Clostridia bacterium]
MKYKLTGIIATALVLVGIIVISFMMPTDNGKRYIEHIDTEEKTPCAGDCSGILCTHLPIVKIDTQGSEIPGKAIYNHEKQVMEYTLAEDGSTTIKAKVSIVDNEKVNNHANDTAKVESLVNIRVRGNSSRHFDKPNYDVEFVNEAGLNNSLEIMGMDAHHEWALHGPFLDKTLIRNYMWYNISGQLMEYAPNVRFCEVMVNGEYRGVYLMCETISAGKDGSRITLSIDKKDNTFTGYILRHDRGSNNDIKNIEPFSIYTFRTDKIINIVSPGAQNLTETLAREISLEFSHFEKAIYSYDFDDLVYGYDGTVDVDNFVDYFIINEVSLNRDAGLYSTYIYKDTDGKFKMCVWDFNNALDNYEETPNGAEGFVLQESIWFNRIIQDEDFTEKIIERYRYLRKNVLSDEYLESFIDETILYLGDAVDRNFEKWGYSFNKTSDKLFPAWRNPRSYSEAVEDMKESLKNRLKWLDENIESIKQYSAASKTRESHETHE